MAGEQRTSDVIRDILLGIYYAHSGVFTIRETAHGATDGYLFLINPSAIKVSVKQMKLISTPTTGTTSVTAPRITIERFTFTGTSSGAKIAIVKRDTTDNDVSALLVTANTGLTITAGNIIMAANVSPVTATGAQVKDVSTEYKPKYQYEEIILRTGEGIIFRQADAGTVSDSRKLFIDLIWEEYR